MENCDLRADLGRWCQSHSCARKKCDKQRAASSRFCSKGCEHTEYFGCQMDSCDKDRMRGTLYCAACFKIFKREHLTMLPFAVIP
jgi:hypothetical protein